MSECPSAYFDKYAETTVERDPEKPEKEKGKEKRPVFTEGDLQTVRRNAEQLLQLHQRFVEMLKKTLESLGFGAAFTDGLPGR